MTTDVELVERSRRRDADAFGALVTRHQQLVFGVALARCHDPALAEDVAQEAFVAAWRDLDRLRDGDRIGAWVAGIARNLAANAVRTRARRERVPAEPSLDAPSPEEEALEREARELLHRALADIPAAHRETVVLYYLEGHSIAQIASALALSEDAVKQRLSRGRQGLRDRVAGGDLWGGATRIETVLTRTRLPPTFRAGVVAALSMAGARKAAAGKVMMMMTTKKLAIATVAVLALAGGVLWVARNRETAGAPIAAKGPSSNTPTISPASSTTSGSAAPTPHVERLADKAARERLVAAIHEAHARRAAAPPSTTSGGAAAAPALPAGDIDREYIRAAVHEIIPLLTACYEEGVARAPKLAGTVMVEFTIEGESDVGGVVGESKIDEAKTSLVDPAVRECIQETMYALKIDPPPSGGVVEVHYPFVFATSDDQVPPQPSHP